MNKTEVMILGTIHGLHKHNSNYSYEDIFTIVDKYKPDVIGVEIREEDILQHKEYLHKSYPYEMIETKFRYENVCKIYGFDWLGKSIEGALIPDNYFSTLEIKLLEKELNEIQEYTREKKLMGVIDNSRIQLLLKSNAAECNSGKYDLLCEIAYAQQDIALEGTPYEVVSRFSRERQAQIDKNIISIIKENPGKKIIFLTGIDHRIFAIKAIQNCFNDEVIIKEIPNI